VSLKLYNTATRRIEPFAPLDPPRVRMYVCGLTPSAEPHIGHFRTYLFFDVLRRYLAHLRYDVRYVQNVTDIDDRSIARAMETGEPWYDIVSGWRKNRQDAALSRKLPSMIANKLISKITGVHLHDVNNGFKAYNREVIEDSHLKLYGEFHRFIPVMAHWRGYRVAEIKVRHHPRKFGVSKYGARRFARGLIDLLNVLFLTTFLRTPLRLFGPLGLWTLFVGVLIDAYVVVASRFFTHEPIHNQPMLFVGILLMIFGVQFILTGLQSEMIRYYAFQPGEEYNIRQELD